MISRKKWFLFVKCQKSLRSKIVEEKCVSIIAKTKKKIKIDKKMNLVAQIAVVIKR